MTPRPAKAVTTRALLIGFALMLIVVSSAWAASEKVLYAFHGKDGWGGGSVILGPDGSLYGTTVSGGTCPGLNCGVVFRLTLGSDGKWYEKVLHDFSGGDGLGPVGTLVSDRAGNLYGTTTYGGPNGCSGLGCGVAFELERGTGGKWTYKILHLFFQQNGDGAQPYAGLIFDSQGNLYGTTSIGGNTSACMGGCGVVFKLTPGAKGQWTETVLYTFLGKDGDGPKAPLTFDSAGNLYGTTEYGGTGAGNVFKLSLGQHGQWTAKVLHSFTSDTKDGYEPTFGLTFDSVGNLYGTTPFGGTIGQQGWGTAFKLTPVGGGKWKETILRSFDEHKVTGGFVSSGLVLDGSGNLYGTTSLGGQYTCPNGGGAGCGVLFKLTPKGSGKWAEAVLHSFGKSGDGKWPSGGLSPDSSGRLFGQTPYGGYTADPCGQDGCGVLFMVTP